MRIGWALIFLAVCSLAPPAFADPLTAAQRAEVVQIIRQALTQDPSILRDAIVAMQADDARRQSQATQATTAPGKIALISPEDPVAGNPHGDVTVVEFYDLRCPYCRGMEPEVTQFLQQDHGVRLVYKDLPILGPPSVLGARALLAAQKQGAYAQLRTALMRDPPDFTLQSIHLDSQKLGLNWDRLQHDMDDPSVQQRLDNNVNLASAMGIEGTPTFVVGQTIISGADLDNVQKAVAAMRSEAGDERKPLVSVQSVAAPSGKS